METASPNYPETAFEHAVEAALTALVEGHTGPFIPSPAEVRQALAVALVKLAEKGAEYEADRRD